MIDLSLLLRCDRYRGLDRMIRIRSRPATSRVGTSWMSLSVLPTAGLRHDPENARNVLRVRAAVQKATALSIDWVTKIVKMNCHAVVLARLPNSQVKKGGSDGAPGRI
jgi:hypothetical protein